MAIAPAKKPADADVAERLERLERLEHRREQTIAVLVRRLERLEQHDEIEATARLAAIAGVVDGPFTSSELIALLDREGDAGAVFGTRDPVRVGIVLHALAGRHLGPYLLERTKRGNRGHSWIVQVEREPAPSLLRRRP